MRKRSIQQEYKIIVNILHLTLERLNIQSKKLTEIKREINGNTIVGYINTPFSAIGKPPRLRID